MINAQYNPIIQSPDNTEIYFSQTRDTLLDTELYSRFIHNIENTFRRSEFYRQYKSFVLGNGLDRDSMMPNINGNAANIELHHHLPTLLQATIMIVEHQLNVNGCVNTFEVIELLEQSHRNNEFGIVMLSEVQHQAFHSNPLYFISLKQCWGDPFKFIKKYIDGMTIDIAFNILMQFRLEDQYGDTYAPDRVKAREEIKSYANYVLQNANVL